MAFGLDRQTLRQWKQEVLHGNIAFLTHYWIDDRFPGCTTVTKVGCNDYRKLIAWGEQYGLKQEWIHHDPDYPHFDLFGERQKAILQQEKQWHHINKFKL
ncbi:hypothetical protein MUN88_16955 [Gracilibacillus caseinilyticus]|uniref:YneQ n=1 Tax=Gracilibacillus caseinilyticus TaxID=2932256 RepID=A0ABY4ETH9_9BACI|nr:hypothetical protein [Gracilibacillus caseinilyticus]UOQ47723.1 hypothetical protein MUN88_16955 [Gracilibacillus caseinilyticus]